MAFTSLLVGLLLGALLMATTGENTTTNGGSGMEAEELLGLFEVVGALIEDPNWTQLHPFPCTDTPWPGIQCEVDQKQHQQQDSVPLFHVTKLHLGPDVANPVCKTSAKLSASLQKLSYLRTLSIVGCFLTSGVSLSPFLFGSFSPLEQLVIKSNPALFGEIPPTLSEIGTLRVLSLSQNSLHGEIPRGLGKLGRLEQLDLSYNNLTGEIPQEIGGLKSLTIFDLGYNELQGQIPCSFGQLMLLEKIDLSSNRFSGTIPPEMGKLKRLVLLDLSHNSLRGPIPDTFSGLKGLQYFLLENNPIETGLPLFLGTLENMNVLSLSGCGFSGEIPISFGPWEHLIALSLDRNNLQGTVPPKLGELPNLGQLNLSQNQLSGELVFTYDFVQRLGERLDVRGNNGLCLGHHLHTKFSLYLDVPLCSRPDASSDKSYQERSKSYGIDGKGTSDASYVTGRLSTFWFLCCNLCIIQFVFL